MAERNLVNLTVTMTKEERKALKQIALDIQMLDLSHTQPAHILFPLQACI